MSNAATRRPDGTEPVCLLPGEYCHFESIWWFNTPTGLLANLAAHDITEHDDGTITVAPSILVRQPSVGEWHGYLERGQWREC